MSVLISIIPPAANHRFNAEESDWGFTRFAEIRRLFAPQWDNKGRPMIENDAVNVTAYLRIYKDPTGVLWHNFIKLVLFLIGRILIETCKVITRRKRPAWLVSRIKGPPVISTHSSNPYTLRTLFARYVAFCIERKPPFNSRRQCTKYLQKPNPIERQQIAPGHFKDSFTCYRATKKLSLLRNLQLLSVGRLSTYSSNKTFKSYRGFLWNVWRSE